MDTVPASALPPTTLPGQTHLEKAVVNEEHGHDSNDHQTDVRSRLRFNRVTLAFFSMGLLVGLPAMITETAANRIFEGFTGIYEVCNSVAAASASFGTPFLARHISYDTCTLICTAMTVLSYLLCTLPDPLAGSLPGNKTGPVFGAMCGGFLYSFGTNVYMAAAAFFPHEAVLALSAGSGLSVVLGPSIYIGVIDGFDQDWRRSFLVMLPTTIFLPAVWWILVDRGCRQKAEQSRITSLAKSPQSDAQDHVSSEPDYQPRDERSRMPQASKSLPKHFSSDYSRLRLLFTKVIPHYGMPLMLCTTTATISMMGSAPSLQSLARFRQAPKDDLQFQLSFLCYGAAQFIFSTLAGLRPIPIVWFWSFLEVALCVIGLVQLFKPFLTYYAVWAIFMFLIGGCVGAGVSNTNYKIARDFRRAGADDDVCSFAMACAGLGNFGGDALGGGLGIMVERLATRYLKRSSQ
ncbi:CLN3-like protein [Elsinoe australis]|uniref:CLN3-like protein n=1 Tax=Elsinoe australis TaxID=40998 RepID=A0A4U7BAW4_9PEZI|nr:CLN3-like protein [Elsinoe australis]